MPDNNDSLKALLRQRKVLADFGDVALQSEDLDEVLTGACRLVGEALGTGRAKVLEIEHGGQSLFVRAGVGWAPDVVGQIHVPMDENSSESFSIRAGEPVITQDISKEDRFEVPEFMKKAGVVALANVPIFLPGKKAYGLLQVDDTEPRDFDQNDTEFLRTYATVLGPVIDRLLKLRDLRSSDERFRVTVEAATDYAIFVTDAEDRITDWLPGAEAVFGWSREEAEGQPSAILFTPEDRKAGVPEQEFETARREGRAQNTREHLRKDGSRVFIEGSVRALRNERGAASRFIKIGQDVTARRAAEAGLRESEARRRLLQTDWETDASGLVIADSPSWRAYTGQTLDEWLGYGWLDAVHPDDRTYAEQQWREAIATHGLVDAEFRLRAPDGGWRWTNVRAAPVLDAGGKIEKWAGMNIDIDARKRAEAALRESEARLRNVLDGMDEAFGLMDRDFRILAQNAEALRLDGRSLEEIVGRTHWEVYPGSEDTEIGRALKRAMAEREPVSLEHLYAWERGQARWLEMRAYPVPEGLAVFWRDVSERKAAEAALRASEEQLRSFGEASLDVLWIRDAETLAWTYLSPAYERIYGLSREEALAGDSMQTWLDLILPEDREHARANLERVRASERVSFEYRITRPSDGEVRLLRDTDFPIRDAAGRVTRIGGVGHDATEEQAMAERQKVLVAELQHRTRNLMGVVTAVTNMTLQGSASLDDFEGRIGDRLGALSRVNGLLSRLHEGDRVRFDDLIRTELLGHGIKVDGEAPSQVRLHGPSGLPLRSSQVQTLALGLHELATNALKYGALSRPEGRLDVTWRVVAGATGDRRLRVEWRESGVPVSQPDGAPADGTVDGTPPRRSGYGRELLEKALPYQLNAETTYELGPDGLRCTITLPLSSTGDESHPIAEPSMAELHPTSGT